MRRFTILLLAAALAPLAPAPLLASPAVAQQSTLQAAAQAYLDAQRGFDQAALSALTTDDFIEISPVGEVDPRAKMLSFYAPDKKRDAPTMRILDPILREHGDTATLITSIEFDVAGPGGEQRTVRMRATYTGRKVAGTWKLTTVQYTPIRG